MLAVRSEFDKARLLLPFPQHRAKQSQNPSTCFNQHVTWFQLAPVWAHQSPLMIQAEVAHHKRRRRGGGQFSACTSFGWPAARRSPFARYAAVAVGTMLAAAAAGVWLGFGRDESRPAAVPQVRNPVQATSALVVESYPTWSPDGSSLTEVR